MSIITCPKCGGPLTLDVGYDGCDEDCLAGKGSGFDWSLALLCDCGRVFHIGRMKRDSDFSPNVKARRCVLMPGEKRDTGDGATT